MSTGAAADAEFTIRIAGAAPPPLPSATPAKKGQKGGGRGSRAGQKGGTAAPPPPQRRYNLRLRPSSSLEEMRRTVLALFDVPSGAIDAYRVSFLGGFPPKELDARGKTTVHELGIRPNESLIVKFLLKEGEASDGAKASAKSAKDSASAAGKKPDPAAAASNNGRPKRASALAATARFGEVIAAQDALMKQPSKKSPKKKSTTTVGNVGGFGSVAGKRSSGAAAAAASKKPKTVQMEGAGYRLSDGKSFAGASPSKRSGGGGGGSKRIKPLFQSNGGDIAQGEQDIASTLLSSVGGGGKGGKVGQFLRAAMKGAVEKSYEATRAAVRVAAVEGGEFGFEKATGGGVGAAGEVLGLYTVSYSKGMEGRGRYEEEVVLYGLNAVKAVLEQVYSTAHEQGDADIATNPQGDKDGRLRPALIAQLSPRVFWSLVYHCTQAAHDTHAPVPPAPTSADDMLRTTLPHLDWSHLDRSGRKRVLSEKARENLRQEEAAVGGPMEAEEAEEVEEPMVDAAMMSAAGNDQGLSERERRARAAMARFGGVSEPKKPTALSPAKHKTDAVDDWQLETPLDDDIDELIECIREGSEADEEAARAWATILLPSVPNWRVLANSNPQLIFTILISGSSVASSDTIESWIDAAQGKALEEIMLEILDGDQDALAALRDEALCGCPKDLMNWQSIPDVPINPPEKLLEIVSRADESNGKWDTLDVLRWIGRAETALGVCPWLELYTTPVE